MFQIAGIPASAFDGRLETALQYLHPDDLDRLRHETRSFQDAPGTFSLDFRLQRPDGQTRFVHAEGRNVRYSPERAARTVGTAQDVTNLRFAEQSLQALTRELMRSNEELEQFAYVASHDLREPLRIISGYLGILDRRYSPTFPAEAQNYMRAALEGAGRMEQLISHLLQYSRIGTRGGAMAATHAEEAFRLALGNLHIPVSETRAVITNDPLPTVIADRAQLVQLFQNLIENALKFRRGTPAIHIAAERRAPECIISVRDNGIGIDPKDQNRVFDLFQRLHPAQEYPGSGIGLAIAKKIVDRHGGRMWLESKPGEGSTFFFTLKLAA